MAADNINAQFYEDDAFDGDSDTDPRGKSRGERAVPAFLSKTFEVSVRVRVLRLRVSFVYLGQTRAILSGAGIFQVPGTIARSQLPPLMTLYVCAQFLHATEYADIVRWNREGGSY